MGKIGKQIQGPLAVRLLKVTKTGKLKSSFFYGAAALCQAQSHLDRAIVP